MKKLVVDVSVLIMRMSNVTLAVTVTVTVTVNVTVTTTVNVTDSLTSEFLITIDYIGALASIGDWDCTE